jgi:hypothetical protein
MLYETDVALAQFNCWQFEGLWCAILKDYGAARAAMSSHEQARAAMSSNEQQCSSEQQ